MAKINYRSQFIYGFAGQPVVLRPRVSIGASGAPTLVAMTGMGVDSVTRISAGQYSLALSNSFYELMGVSAISISGSSAPAAPGLNIVSQAVTSATAPAIVIQFRDGSGAAADPASGEILLISITLNRSSTGC